MNIAALTYVIVGPNAGKTMTINGRDFLEGRHEHVGPEHEHNTLINLFSRFYSVFPEQVAAHEQAKYDALVKGEPAPSVLETVLTPAPVAAPIPEPTTEPVVPQGGVVEAGKPALVGETPRETVVEKPLEEDKPLEGDARKLTLAEAIGLLDPEVDDHWTSNNLPALDVLSDLMGGMKVGRADVEDVASGYTRSAARKARS